MIAYITRRCLYAIPILLGVNLIIFFLFFYVNTPDDMARKILGEKNISREVIERWKQVTITIFPSFSIPREKAAPAFTRPYSTKSQ